MNNKSYAPSKQKSGLSNLINIIPYLRSYKIEICFVFIALIITAIMVLVMGKVVKYLIDFGFASKDHNHLDLVLVIFLVAILVMAVAGYFRSYLINSIGEKVIADLRIKIYSHIIKVSAEFFEITKTGDVISRLTVDTTLLYNIISNSMSFIVRNMLLFIGGIVFLFLTSVKLTLVSLTVIPLAILPIFIIGKKIKNFSRKSQDALGIVGSHIEETVNGFKTIQSYLCEEKEIKNFTNYIEKALDVSLQKIRIRSLLISLVIIFAFGSVAVVLWFGGHEVLNDKITAGSLSSFIFYSIITATSLASVAQDIGQLHTASAAASRLFELLEIESPISEIAAPEKLKTFEQIKIKFENVNFSYPSRKEILVLKNFNLEIKPGQKVAIVGSSGSGKSTILQLLMRFYDCDCGQILIGDQDIKNLYLADLRKLFSYISQDCFIFSGTIYENIAYGSQDVKREEIEKIIAENEALNFINMLPHGLDSFVGEKGIKLSGGERQRIAVARAIIKNSPILLLDEATSSLDNKNEQLVTKLVNQLMKNRTTISIAHRLTTIVNSDLIIFVRDGKIAESGTHNELMIKNELYQKMYEAEAIGIHSGFIES